MTEHTTSANFWHPISKQRGNWWVMWLHHPISKQFHVWSCDKISHRDDLQQQHLFLSISLQSVHLIVRKCEIHVKTTMFCKLWTRIPVGIHEYCHLHSSTHIYMLTSFCEIEILKVNLLKLKMNSKSEWIFVLKHTQKKKLIKFHAF